MRITLDPHYSSKDNELSPCSDVGSSKRGSKKPERYLGFEDDDDSEEEAGLFALPSEESEQEHCLTQNAVDDSEVEVSLLPSILYEKHRELNSKQSTVVLALPAYNINRPWPFQKRKEPKRKCYKKPVVVLALPSSADMFSNLKNRRRSMVAKRANQGDDISLSNQKGNDIRMLAAYAQDNPPFGCAKENEIDDFSRLCEYCRDNTTTLMEAKSERRGGCVISHTPGAGKTFLVIAFLVSYLKLFPDKKPLILAPKTTLYTWYKEFSKWEIPIPVYLIRDRKKLRDFGETPLTIPGVPNPSNDVKHVLDCLQKIKKWHLHSSVLVMGYTSFLSLTRENSKYEHKKYMAKALRESTGILILDEGHNPRSTKSRLRIELMKVETELRILLSGTLFQNNFGEYFNTLCLARPKFVQEVLKELDTKQKKGNDKIPENAKHFLETRARKFFLDDIANKIDSSDDEVRMRGLNMLRKMTSGFIDVYESGNFENLPGLEIYTLVMNLTDVQNELLQKLQKKMVGSSVFPLEGELMVTLGSIHPWLIKTATSSNKFYTSQELNQLEKFKSDFKVGSKVRFILSLIIRVVKEEKVLIFCRNLAPMKLLAQLFEECFNWKKGREILLLYGEQDLFERGNVIDNFEDRYGVSKVLLASITACAEGISLTAASRLIFLDSEWNPSKIKQAIARAFRPGQEKMVYVYQLLAKGSMEEDKYRRTTWKEWVSNMIFSEDFSENPSQWQAEKIEDDILREMVENDNPKAIHMIMKNEKASTN
ncbi:SNF2-related, N-terminal domain [Sesbania bispinosa]|nr:SNF2-related, N-terminal domain [Sesbania bispinosa]